MMRPWPKCVVTDRQMNSKRRGSLGSAAESLLTTASDVIDTIRLLSLANACKGPLSTA